MIETKGLTIGQIIEMLEKGEVSSLELTKEYIRKIESLDGDINAYLEVFESALDEAKAADERRAKKEKLTELTGVPYSIKDNILYKGKIASAGSKLLENHTATFDSHAVELLKSAGAVCLGRTNMDEFAMGSSTEYSAFGPTKNPLDPTRVPGGTSGGAAASVAYGGAAFGLGSDTAGSVRQPASFCGVVGLKPTYGAVSRRGLIALGSSLDCIGTLTNTVSDAATVFNAIAKHDNLDSTSANDGIRDSLAISNNKRIGVPRKFIESIGVKDFILENFNQVLGSLEEEFGYEIVDVDIPNMGDSLPVYYIILPAEASSNLARYDGIRYGLSENGKDLMDVYLKTRSNFGPEARRRILIGNYVLSSGYFDDYYQKATRLRDLIVKQHSDVFKDVCCIITPTTNEEAFKFGEKTNDPVEMYKSDIFTAVANITGLPSISIPTGKGPNNMPISVQLTSYYFSENVLFDIGEQIEML